jgi:uncharacterized glyoxalase superfamily protein PhnB
MIALNTGNDRVGEQTGFVFGATDPEATAKELEERGVEFVDPVSKREWGGTMGSFKDTDGNILTIHDSVA